VKDPACDCGGSVLVKEVTHGAIVEVFREHSPGNHVLIGRYRAGAACVSVDVPRLKGKERLRAAQRIGAQRSGLGPFATAVDPPHWSYVPNSASRLCQLTQDSDPGDRPHPVPTTPFGIVGTDLGISVEHEGRLYLFFGDTSPEWEDQEGWDPIAWVTTSDVDELKDQAPDVQWLLNGAGKYHWLSLHGKGLGYLEVPTGGFSYDGRLYLFIGCNRQENPPRMTTSVLAVRNDPYWDFHTVGRISSTTGEQILVTEPEVHLAPYPGGRWMLHISPTVVRNADSLCQVKN
jgi:hypothetical protein